MIVNTAEDNDDEFDTIFQSPRVNVKTANNVDLVFKQNATNPKSQSADDGDDKLKQPINTCRVLQRKLELKVERAKKNYKQFHQQQQQQHSQRPLKQQDKQAFLLNHENKVMKPKSSSLIPISRLSIPGCTENQPLVEYTADNSDGNGDHDRDEDDDDDDDNVTFFPVKSKSSKKLDLSDTFSIQEMTIESNSEDDSESQNLEFLMPKSARVNLMEKLNRICCCAIK